MIKVAAIGALLVSTAAGAVGLPAPDFSKWARTTLDSKGMNDARVVETKYPFYFTFCDAGSSTLWRYDVMSETQIEEVRQGKVVKPLTEDQRKVQVEADSASCKDVADSQANRTGK